MKSYVKNLIIVSLIFLSIGLIATAQAAQDPTSLLQTVANRMIVSLERNKNNLNSPVIYRIVNSVLVPHIDTYRMAGAVVGRQYWDRATPAQKQEFINLFKRVVVNYYSNALATYNGDRVQFYPLRGGASGNTVNVRSVIVRPNGQRIAISYNLFRSGNTWKVYDFSIENVSIVRNYHAQFAGVLAQSGLAGLIQRLRGQARR